MPWHLGPFKSTWSNIKTTPLPHRVDFAKKNKKQKKQKHIQKKQEKKRTQKQKQKINKSKPCGDSFGIPSSHTNAGLENSGR